MNLFSKGFVVLHSGTTSLWKIECDALTKEDWEGLALIAMEKYSLAFSEVIGVPRGGLQLAKALEPYRSLGGTLIVDDVLTTGNSMNEYLIKYPNSSGLVAFARGIVPDNVKAIWS